MESAEVVLEIANESETEALGRRLAELLVPPQVISLSGTLGAGKTRLVRALATALGVAEWNVVSPTFSLCQTYQGRVRLHHFDVYRLHDDDEFLDLGPEEQFEDDAITLVEWGDRVERLLPEDTLHVHLDVVDREQRRVTVRATTPRLRPLLQALGTR